MRSSSAAQRRQKSQAQSPRYRYRDTKQDQQPCRSRRHFVRKRQGSSPFCVLYTHRGSRLLRPPERWKPTVPRQALASCTILCHAKQVSACKETVTVAGLAEQAHHTKILPAIMTGSAVSRIKVKMVGRVSFCSARNSGLHRAKTTGGRQRKWHAPQVGKRLTASVHSILPCDLSQEPTARQHSWEH